VFQTTKNKKLFNEFVPSPYEIQKLKYTTNDKDYINKIIKNSVKRKTLMN